MQMNSSPIKKLSYQIKLFSKNLCADGSATLCSKSEVMLTVLNCIYLLLWWVNFERSCGSKKHVLFLLPQLNWKGRSDLTLKAQKTNKTFWAISSDIYWKRTFSIEKLIIVFPHIVSAETILFWIQKNESTLYYTIARI